MRLQYPIEKVVKLREEQHYTFQTIAEEMGYCNRERARQIYLISRAYLRRKEEKGGVAISQI